MADYSALTDEDLGVIIEESLAERAKRAALAQTANKIDALNRDYKVAEGVTEGAAWVQPTGAHDAYPLGWTVSHNGSDWVSTLRSNVWEPGVTGWDEVLPEGVYPDWQQPTGAQDAYNIGDRVIFEGQTWESLIDANTWSPTAYPAGWQLITE